MNEVLVSVDVEASGPTPTTGSLVSVGACLVNNPDKNFYREIKPVREMSWSTEAEGIHGLSREYLERSGIHPEVAMTQFKHWLESLDGRPIFVGFNATFDWMFVADYFHRFVGMNPFGISGLDLKAYFMGKHNQPLWKNTTKRNVRKYYPNDPSLSHTHNALDDAKEQAQLARVLLVSEV